MELTIVSRKPVFSVRGGGTVAPVVDGGHSGPAVGAGRGDTGTPMITLNGKVVVVVNVVVIIVIVVVPITTDFGRTLAEGSSKPGGTRASHVAFDLVDLPNTVQLVGFGRIDDTNDANTVVLTIECALGDGTFFEFAMISVPVVVAQAWAGVLVRVGRIAHPTVDTKGILLVPSVVVVAKAVKGCFAVLANVPGSVSVDGVSTIAMELSVSELVVIARNALSSVVTLDGIGTRFVLVVTQNARPSDGTRTMLVEAIVLFEIVLGSTKVVEIDGGGSVFRIIAFAQGTRSVDGTVQCTIGLGLCCRWHGGETKTDDDDDDEIGESNHRFRVSVSFSVSVSVAVVSVCVCVCGCL